MGNKILVLLFVLLVGTISCQKVRNPIERNILSFESAIDSVIDAMDRINLILNNSIDDEYISIIIGKDKMLYFDDSKYKIHKVGYTYDKQLDTNKLWSFVSKSNRKMLVEQILYLYDNKVEGLKVINAVYIYRYRSHIYMADRQKNLQRYLILTNNPKEIDTHRFKIIDNYKNLYLLANKGARIWTK